MRRYSIAIGIAVTAMFAPTANATVLKAQALKVVLHDTATVWPDGNGFFTLGEISDISGGTPEMRDRLDNVEVGRAPLDGYVRHLELGDVALKPRQAGIDPVRDLKLAGAEDLQVSKATGTATPGTPPSTGTTAGSAVTPTGASAPAAPPQIVIKRGDPVTIVLQDGEMTITAAGESLDNGAVGDTIRIRRDGVTNNIQAQVLDDRTVQMEM